MTTPFAVLLRPRDLDPYGDLLGSALGDAYPPAAGRLRGEPWRPLSMYYQRGSWDDYALVLAWDHKAIPEGCDRAALRLAQALGVDDGCGVRWEPAGFEEGPPCWRLVAREQRVFGHSGYLRLLRVVSQSKSNDGRHYVDAPSLEGIGDRALALATICAGYLGADAVVLETAP